MLFKFYHSSSADQKGIASLIKAIKTNDEMSDGKRDKATLRWEKIQEYLKIHNYIMNADVRKLRGVSAATSNLILASLVEEGKLRKGILGIQNIESDITQFTLLNTPKVKQTIAQISLL